MKTDGQSDDGQRRIWSHFENAGAESFEGAKTRLDCLIGEIGRRTKSPRVLTVGIGNGYLEMRIVERGWSLVALDPDEQAVERLRGLGIDARCGVMEAIPSGDEEFDCVVASEVLEHLTEAQGQAALEQVARVLRPGGFFIGTVPLAEDLRSAETVCPKCGEVFHRWGHRRSFDERILRDHLRPMFASVLVRRRVFVTLGRASLWRNVKSAARWILGMLGEKIASPNLLFIAQKAANDRGGRAAVAHDSTVRPG